MRENRHFNKGNNKEQRALPICQNYQRQQSQPHANTITPHRAALMSEKRKRKNALKSPFATLQPQRNALLYDITTIQHSPNIAPASTTPRKPPKLLYEFLQKWGGCRLCRGCAAFSQKKGISKNFTAHHANADFTKQKAKSITKLLIIVITQKPRKALHIGI